MGRSRLAGTLAMVLLMVFLAGGCGAGGEATTTAAMAVATPKPTANVTVLNIAIPQDVATLHPLRATQREVRSLLGLVYESMIVYDENGQPTGGLASSLTPDDTGLIWTIKLRPQVQWQRTGRTISADDVIYTLDLIRQIGAEGSYANVLNYLTNWEKVDNTTVKITAAHAFYGTLMAFDFPIVPCDAGYSATEVPQEAVGTGPYLMGQLVAGQDLTLTVNEKWWKQQPAIKTIVAKRFKDSQTAATSLMLRQLDVVQSEDLITEQYSYTGDANAYEYETPYFDCLAFNFTHPAVADVRLRQAVAYAIDRKSIVSNVYLNHATLADDLFPATNALLGKQIELMSRDTEKAKSLLSQMGWSAQTALTLLIYNNQADPLREEAAKLIVKQLGEVGITVNIVTKNLEDYNTAVTNGDFDMLLAGWYMSDIPDPSFCLSSTGAGNVMKYMSPDMDAKLAALLSAKRNDFTAALNEVRSQLKSDMPFVSLYFRNHTLLTSFQVKGVGRVAEADAFASIDQWIIHNGD